METSSGILPSSVFGCFWELALCQGADFCRLHPLCVTDRTEGDIYFLLSGKIFSKQFRRQ